MLWKSYHIEKYSTGWDAQSFPNWLIKDENGADICKVERTSNGSFGGNKWHLFGRFTDYMNPTATIQLGWLGTWNISLPDGDATVTVYPPWIGSMFI
jgi:hypothetical protein